MQKLYNTISLIVIIVLFIIVLVQDGCGSGQKDRGTVIARDTIVQIDTLVRLERVRDTLWTLDTFYITETLESPLEVVYGPQTGDSINRYSGIQSDSSININYQADVKGELLGLKLNYNLLKPVHITEYIDRDIITTKTTTEKRYMHGFYIGSGLSYSNGLKAPTFSGSAMLTTPKGMAYDYNYNFTTKEHSLGVKIRLLPIRRNVRQSN